MWWKVMKVSALREEIELDNKEDLDGSEFPDCFGFFGFQKEGGRLLGFRKHGFHIKSLIKGFIKFLYGFELTDEDIDLNTSKELLKMGDMYEVKGLSKQSCYLIKNLLTKENVFENLSFCKKINSEKGVKICCKFIAKHFNPTRGSLWNASRVAGGGQILPAPIKTSLEAILTQIFHITWIWNQI